MGSWLTLSVELSSSHRGFSLGCVVASLQRSPVSGFNWRFPSGEVFALSLSLDSSPAALARRPVDGASLDWLGRGQMSSPIKRYAFFFFASFLSCFLITVGVEIWVWSSIRGKSFSYALSNSAGQISTPTIAIFTYAPFLVVAWICGSLARVSWSRALGL